MSGEVTNAALDDVGRRGRAGCAVCGLEIHFIVERDGERWIHTVEPTGHVASPSRLVDLGRARAMNDLLGQLNLSMEKGATIDADWVRDWIKWFGDPSLFPTQDEENASYRRAMEDMGYKFPEKVPA